MGAAGHIPSIWSELSDTLSVLHCIALHCTTLHYIASHIYTDILHLHIPRSTFHITHSTLHITRAHMRIHIRTYNTFSTCSWPDAADESWCPGATDRGSGSDGSNASGPSAGALVWELDQGLWGISHDIPSGKHTTKIWNITLFNGQINCKWPFSIAMLVYQRVTTVFMGFIQLVTGRPGLVGLCQLICWCRE